MPRIHLKSLLGPALIALGAGLLFLAIWHTFDKPKSGQPSLTQRDSQSAQSAISHSAHYLPAEWDYWFYSTPADREAFYANPLLSIVVSEPVHDTLKRYRPSTIAFGNALVLWHIEGPVSTPPPEITQLFSDFQFLTEPVSEGVLWLWYRPGTDDIVIDKHSAPSATGGHLLTTWLQHRLQWAEDPCAPIQQLIKRLPIHAQLQFEPRTLANQVHLKWAIDDALKQALTPLRTYALAAEPDDLVFQREANLNGLLDLTNCPSRATPSSVVFKQWYINNDPHRLAIFTDTSADNMNGDQAKDFPYSYSQKDLGLVILASSNEALHWAKTRPHKMESGLLQEVVSVQNHFRIHSQLRFQSELQLSLSVTMHSGETP